MNKRFAIAWLVVFVEIVFDTLVTLVLGAVVAFMYRDGKRA